jgi:hypothetical protein
MNRMPTLFVSHGAPTFAIEPGLAGPNLTAPGQRLHRPRAVLVVSPHWMTTSPRVGLAAQTQTIHDFGGFDLALYDVVYPVDMHPLSPEPALLPTFRPGRRAGSGLRGRDVARRTGNRSRIPRIRTHRFGPDLANLPQFRPTLLKQN